MSQLILMRHGQSVWNKLNLFTGWVDIPLSNEGINEAIEAGKLLKNIPIDIIFTSSLIRAQMTAFLVMNQHSTHKVPVIQHTGKGKVDSWSQFSNAHTEASTIPLICAWELNERMYGDLQGLNKAETIEKFGVDQVKIWRRSYDIAPPGGESLQMTAERSIPYFKEKIAPMLEQGKNVFVSAHGNSLRSIIMYLENMTKEQILEFELTTGAPVIYEYKNGKFIKEPLV